MLTQHDIETRAAYRKHLEESTDASLAMEANARIWLSAYANNNPRSAFHWQCDAVYDECQRRGKVEIYTQEHAKLLAEAKGE